MAEEKLKVLVASDLVVETGFSTVSHNIIKFNQDRFDITGLGVNYNGDPHNYTFPIYPAMIRGNGNIYGIDRLCTILNGSETDVLFILNDAWVISYYLDAIKKNVTTKLPRIVTYFPVDSRYHDRNWYKDFDIVNEAYTYTDFGKEVVKECMPEMEVGVIPHGINTEDFYQLYEDRKKAKTDLYGDRLKGIENPEDSFIVLNANRNQPRKKLDITIKGFAMFAQDKPSNVRLYMHCGVVDSHVNIVKQAQRWGMDNRLIFTSMAQGIQHATVMRLNQIYNSTDVGINTSLGEGWGLTNVEHAVTGAVQLVPDHSSCGELFGDCGLVMKPFTDITFDNSETVGRMVSPEAVADGLEFLYNNESVRKQMSNDCRDKFLRPEYQWKNIAESFGDAFERVTE
jgi:glycosyltransferase involved in cell wall biosynthesis